MEKAIRTDAYFPKNPWVMDILRCPLTGQHLRCERGFLTAENGSYSYLINKHGIPLFGDAVANADAKMQEAHYDKVAASYLANLGYPHTQEYMQFLDAVFLDAVSKDSLGTVLELCCGRGEAFALLGGNVKRGVGVDISQSMLLAAKTEHAELPVEFIQGDATKLPLADDSVESVMMLGGIHHVTNRERLFSEIRRVLVPGGKLYFREPVSDFFLWRWIRAVIYRISPSLDHTTERPLRYGETVPLLERLGMRMDRWETHGFVGFCLFMNSDILLFNRLFRFIPGIRLLVRLFTTIDNVCLRLPFMSNNGLQVVGCAVKSPRAE